MNCKQFQEVLPHIIESGGSPDEEAHLDSCHECSSLVRDLRYIAEQARLLLPMHDPNPRVWRNIQQSLAREGLSSEGRMSRQGHLMTNTTTQKKKLDTVRIGRRHTRRSRPGLTSDKLSIDHLHNSGKPGGTGSGQ